MDKINFILDNMPDLYNKEQDSNLYKILNAISKELDTFVSNTEEVKKAKFVDFATSSDLDKIASILNLKRFNNESDDSFRSRIKSRVPSFIGGGTISALKQVVNNYLGVEPTIIEHYKSGEGHPVFNNGVLNGLNVSKLDASNIAIKGGYAYTKGARFSLNDLNIPVTPSGTQYVKYNLIADGTLTTANFVNKISASLVENPHILKYGLGSTILAPSGFTTEGTQTHYDGTKILDNSVFSGSTNTSGSIRQILYSFNFIEQIERNIGKIPASDVAGKVAWLKSNISQVTVNWYGYGNGPSGNKAYFAGYLNNGTTWTVKSNTSTTPSLISWTTTSISNLIFSDGFANWVAYTDASDGTITSSIYTDFIEVKIYLKQNAYATIEADNAVKENQISLASIDASLNPTDTRFILNPEQHAITNTASITVQIPFNFTLSNIPLESVKDILRNTKAAGIALLINVMETYNDYIQVTDLAHSYFLMGFSGIGGNNILGGQ
jgi:hypothetical protein